MDKKTLLILLLLTAIIYFSGIQIPVMDVDASQYASMSKEMLHNGSYLQVYDAGEDYLDKPPFLFWISAASMKIFGVNNFGYRLPSILFALLALYSTYRFTLLYYQKKIAQIAAMVLATCQAMFLITHDVRTDTILMSWVILSVWQLAEWFKSNRWINLIIGFAAIGGGMITKGPIALLVPLFGFGSHFALQRNFKAFFKWQYLLGVIILALVLLPMSIGLYRQFDLHPEKLIDGKHNVSGLRFFYWTQSFGRITGESKWDNNSGFFFLLQNMLWAFLPWIIFFIAALLKNAIRLIKNKFKTAPGEELITFGGFVLTYCSLALSHYQLPHYIFVVFPFAAVITANYIYDLCWYKRDNKTYNIFFSLHGALFFILLLAVNSLVFYFFPETSVFWKVFTAVATVVYLYLLYQKKWQPKLVVICVYTILMVNVVLNNAFYPALLQYQSGNVAAKWINNHHIPEGKMVIFGDNVFGRSFNFYIRQPVPVITDPFELKEGDYVLTIQKEKQKLDSISVAYKIVYTGEDFHVSTLDLKFLNPATRKNEVQLYYILQVLQMPYSSSK